MRDEHDDLKVSIGCPYNDVVGVSNIIYGLGVEADAGVCFGVVATQYVNGIMLHYIIFNEESRHSPRWPTYTWRSCMICA